MTTILKHIAKFQQDKNIWTPYCTNEIFTRTVNGQLVATVREPDTEIPVKIAGHQIISEVSQASCAVCLLKMLEHHGTPMGDNQLTVLPEPLIFENLSIVKKRKPRK